MGNPLFILVGACRVPDPPTETEIFVFLNVFRGAAAEIVGCVEAKNISATPKPTLR